MPAAGEASQHGPRVLRVGGLAERQAIHDDEGVRGEHDSLARALATARALRRASRAAASGEGASSSVSSAPLGTTSKSGQMKRSSSRRLGEAEARITRRAPDPRRFRK